MLPPDEAPAPWPVTDILVWVDCYTSLFAVLSVEYPTKTPEFMAYKKNHRICLKIIYGGRMGGGCKGTLNG